MTSETKQRQSKRMKEYWAKKREQTVPEVQHKASKTAQVRLSNGFEFTANETQLMGAIRQYN